MTTGGALSDLNNLLNADDIPCYYKPSIKAVMDTIALEQEPCEDAIKNGIPLPKGHGRLIDADVLWDLYHSNDYDFYEALDRAPTIIEADRSEEE